MTSSRRVRDLLKQLAAAEERFFASDFLAPAVRGGTVHVRIAGIICRFRVDAAFEGWGVFRPRGPAEAYLLRPASLAERSRYLALCPRRRLVLCQPEQRCWLAWPAEQNDKAAPEVNLVPVRLVEEAERFESVVARSDGVQYWFESVDDRADPAAVRYLREALRERTPPEQVRRHGLTAGQRAAYAVAHELRRQAERDRTEDRLHGALHHAGAALTGYLERDDGYRVEFEIDGRRHVSVVDKRDLSLQVAGICLSGEDHQFDLQSLVGVLREGHTQGVLHVGAENEGIDEEHYWQVHPPRHD
jgi:hypothetical protein